MSYPEDRPRAVKVRSSETVYEGAIWALKVDEFDLGDETLRRDYIQHPGAVAVLAVNAAEEILVITQYRHPVGQELVEIPAGLLDVPGEDPLAAAKRELLEETGFSAASWHCLVDVCTSPGANSEGLRIFLAKDLTEVGRDLTGVTGEELHLVTNWVPAAEAAKLVLAGLWQNPTAVSGVLAYSVAGAGELRPADAPWPLRESELSTGRVFKADDRGR